MKRIVLLTCLLCFGATYTKAQCPSGQLEVTIDVATDQWGYEIYWELLTSGTACGNGALFSGGNSNVGCNGGGLQNQNMSGYGNNTTITEGPWCLTEGADYDISFVDDYGDGGAAFTAKISGFPIYTVAGMGASNTYTFTVTAPPTLEDVELMSIETGAFVEQGDVKIKGDFRNLGTTTISSVEINYSIDNGATNTQTLTGLNLGSYETFYYVHSNVWSPPASGSYSLKVWVSNVNGAGADDEANNDEMTKGVTVVAEIPNIMPSYTTSSITLTHEIVGNSSDQLNKPRDLDFHPSGDLWVINRGIVGNVSSGGGTTVTFGDPGGTGQTSTYKKDSNSKHFMNEPTAMAFGLNGNWANSPGAYDANFGTGSPFTGPALWSGDLSIYGVTPPGGNGSHLDMLHVSSYAMGIAHETGNVYWVFDGNENDIVRYDFGGDHGPGNTDHDDGKIHRYTGMSVSRIDNLIPSHMELHKSSGWLYIVDNGNQRVIRLDINSGTVGGSPSYGPFETLEEYKNVDGATWEVVVSSGLVEPSGIDVIGTTMIVTDHDNGDIIIYNIATMPAVEVKRIATGEPGIMGTVIGPEGRIWYVNYNLNKVVKIEPSQIVLSTPDGNPIAESNFTVYPNPSNGMVSLYINEIHSNSALITVQDIFGKTLFNTRVEVGIAQLDLSNLATGVYMITMEDNGRRSTEKLVIQK